eukprot:2355296-Prymnesium_polylepis.3
MVTPFRVPFAIAGDGRQHAPPRRGGAEGPGGPDGRAADDAARREGGHLLFWEERLVQAGDE